MSDGLGAFDSTNQFVFFNGHRFSHNATASLQFVPFQRRLEPGQSAVVLLGLEHPPGPALTSFLASHGVDLLDYVPDHGWIARVHGADAPASIGQITFLQPWDENLRVQPGLRTTEASTAGVPVYVHAVRDRSAAALLPELATRGFAHLTAHAIGQLSYVAGIVTADRLDDFLDLVARHPDVQWIERGEAALLLNDEARRITQAGGFLDTTPFLDHGIHGFHQLIAICDTGIDIDSCYFRHDHLLLPPLNRLDDIHVNPSLRKVVAVTFLDPNDDPSNPSHWDNHGHGTAVAGSAAGSNLYDPFAADIQNGIAPGAQLIIQDAGFQDADLGGVLIGLGRPVTNFYPALLQAVAQGATIHNNSWSDRDVGIPQNVYTQICRELDFVTWSHRQLLVVCAAGNNSLSNTVAGPSIAKNALSVAASMSGLNQDRIATFSSRGWASDGRFKPDLAAPGHSLRTAANDGDITTDNCYQTSRSGTSFASPVVAGLAAIVRDYFAQGYYPTGVPIETHRQPNISAALVKAVLINAAMPMTAAAAPPPARDQGWGRVNLSRTLKLPGDTHSLMALDQPLVFTETPAFPYTVYLNLRSTNQPLKATLVWTDYPATPGADKHLVNDLDLRLRTPSLTLWGNHYSDGQSVPGGTQDRLNNVEQIIWTPTSTGIVEISVWAHRIVVPNQDFALVVTGDFDPIDPLEDRDQDGLPDYWELWHFGNLDASPDDDPDQDGASNRLEFLANTDPNDARSVPRLTVSSFTDGMLSFTVNVSEARQYTLEHATTATPEGPWSPISTPLLIGEPIGEGIVSFSDRILPHPSSDRAQFYRVRIQSCP